MRSISSVAIVHTSPSFPRQFSPSDRLWSVCLFRLSPADCFDPISVQCDRHELTFAMTHMCSGDGANVDANAFGPFPHGSWRCRGTKVVQIGPNGPDVIVWRLEKLGIFGFGCEMWRRVRKKSDDVVGVEWFLIRFCVRIVIFWSNVPKTFGF